MGFKQKNSGSQKGNGQINNYINPFEADVLNDRYHYAVKTLVKNGGTDYMQIVKDAYEATMRYGQTAVQSRGVGVNDAMKNLQVAQAEMDDFLKLTGYNYSVQGKTEEQLTALYNEKILAPRQQNAQQRLQAYTPYAQQNSARNDEISFYTNLSSIIEKEIWGEQLTDSERNYLDAFVEGLDDTSYNKYWDYGYTERRGGEGSQAYRDYFTQMGNTKAKELQAELDAENAKTEGQARDLLTQADVYMNLPDRLLRLAVAMKTGAEVDLIDAEEAIMTKVIRSLSPEAYEIYKQALLYGELTDDQWAFLDKFGKEKAADMGLADKYIPLWEMGEYETWFNDYYKRNTLAGAQAWFDAEPDNEEANRNLWFLQRKQEYSQIPQAEDFAEKSKAIQKELGVFRTDDESKYAYINDLSNQRFISGLNAGRGGVEDPLRKYYFMEPEEVGIYNYLHAQEDGQKKADEYLQYLEYDLYDRMNTEDAQRLYEFSGKNGWNAAFASGASIIGSLERGVGFLDALSQRLFGGDKPINYGRAGRAGITTDAIRQGVMDSVEWKLNIGGREYDAFDFLYSTGMSWADSAAAGAMFGPTGAGVALGLSAAESTFQAAREKGADVDRALIAGVFAGAFEGLFEKWSIGKLRDTAKAVGKQNFWKNLGWQVFVNADEELNTDLANMLFDNFIMGDLIDYNLAVKEYERLGMETKEAEARARQDIYLQLAETALGGGLMGGGSAVTSSTISAVNTASSDKQAGKAIIAHGTTQVLHDLADKLGDDTKAGKRLKKLAEKYDPKKATNRQTGSLYREVINALPQKMRAPLNERMMLDIDQKLKELGETGDTAKTADAIRAMLAGEKISEEQSQAIAQSEHGLDVAKDLLGMNEATAETGEQAAEEDYPAWEDNAADVNAQAAPAQEQNSPDQTQTDLQDKYDKEVASHNQTKEDLDAMTAKQGETQAALDAKTEEYNQALTDLETANKNIQTLETTISGMEKDLADLDAQLDKQEALSEQELQKVQADKAAIESELAIAQASLNGMTAERDELAGRVTTLEGEKTALQDKYDKEVASHNQTKADLADAQTAHANTQADLDKKTEELKETQTALNKTEADLKVTQAALNRANSTVKANRVTIEAIQKEQERLQAKLADQEALSEQERQEAQAEMDRLQSELAIAETALATSEQEYADLEAQLLKEQADRSALEEKYAKEKADLEAAVEKEKTEKNQTKTALDALTEEHNQTKADLDTLTEEHKKTQNALSDMTAKQAETQTALDEMTAKQGETQAALDKKDKELEETQTALNEANVRITTAENTISTMQQEKADLEAKLADQEALSEQERKEAEQKLAEVNSELAIANAALETEQKEQTELENQLSTLQGEKEDLQAALEQEQAEQEELQAQLTTLQNDKAALEGQLAANQEEQTRLQAQLDKQTAMTEAAEAEADALQKELDAVKKLLPDYRVGNDGEIVVNENGKAVPLEESSLSEDEKTIITAMSDADPAMTQAAVNAYSYLGSLFNQGKKQPAEVQQEATEQHADEGMQDAKSFAKGFKRAVELVKAGKDILDSASPYVAELHEAVKKYAVQYGEAMRQEELRKQEQANIQQAHDNGFQTLQENGEKVGVSFARVTKKVTEQVKTQLKLIDMFAKKYNLRVHVYDSLNGGNANGAYKKGTNQINLAMDAEGGLLTRTVSHESFHFIESWNKDAAQKLQDFVVKTLLGKEGYNLKKAIQDKIAEYSVNNVELTEQEATREIVADSLLDVIGTEENLKQLMKQNQTLVEKLSEGLKKFVADLKAMMQHLAGSSAEVKALQGDMDYYSNILQMVDKALTGAKENYAAAQYKSAPAMQDSAVQEYLSDMKGAVTQEDSKAALNGLVSNLFVRAEKGWMANNMDANLDEAMQNFADALKSYMRGEMALENALKRAGFDAQPYEMNTVLSYAGRQLLRAENRGQDGDSFSMKKNPDRQAEEYSFKKYQISKTETPQFRAWFGESKAKNPDGTPKIFYHGTREENGEFWVFDYSKAVKKGGLGLRALGQGNYFTSVPLTGNERYGSRVIKAYLRIEKPFEYDGGESIKEQVARKLEIDVSEVSNNIQDTLREYGYDGVIQREKDGKMLAVVFDSNQIKSVTDNVGAFDPENPDIRYSMKKSDIAKSVEEDAALFAQVKSDSDIADAMTLLEKMHHLLSMGDGDFEGRLSEIADRLKEETGSQMSKRKLMHDLRVLYTSMNNKGVDMGEVMMYAREIAMRLLDQAPGIVNELDESTQDLLQTLKTNPFYLTDDMKSEIRGTMGSVADYRRKNFGKMQIRAKTPGMSSLADVWAETLNPLRPDVFTLDATEADMPIILDAFLETANKKTYSSFFEGNLDQYATDIGLSILLEYYDLPGLARQGQILRQELKDKQNQIRTEYKQKYEQRITASRERKQNTEAKQKMRKKIIRVVRSMYSKLHTDSDTKHVPQALKGAVSAMIRPFLDETGVFSGPELRAILQEYSRLAEGGKNQDIEAAYAYDKDIQDKIERVAKTMDGRRLSQLTLEELTDLRDIVGNLNKIIVEQNLIQMNGRKMTLWELGSRALGEQKMKKTLGPKLEKAMNALYINMTPIYYFKRLGGVFVDLWNEVRSGQTKYIFNVKKAKQYIEEQIRKYNAKNWYHKKENLKFTTREGDEIELNMGQAMYLYATWKRELTNKMQDAAHLRIGGFVYAKTDANGKLKIDTDHPHAISQEDMNRIMGYMGEEAVNFVDETVRYLSEDMAALGNETSMERYGYEKFGEGYYFPYKVDSDYTETNLNRSKDETPSSLFAWGASKKTTARANKPVVLGDYMDTWANHVNEMCVYNGFATAVDNLNRVYNFVTPSIVTRDADGNIIKKLKTESLRAEIARAHGKGADKYLADITKSIAGGQIGRSDDVAFMNKMVSKFRKNAVVLSASVAIQQPSSIMRAMAHISPKYFVGKLHSPRKSYEEMMQYSGTANVKAMGKFDIGMGQSAQQWMLDDLGSGSKLKDLGGKADELMGKAPEVMDQLTWASLWEAVKREQRAMNPMMDHTSEAFLQKCGERFDEVVDLTQVYDSVLSRSKIMRSKDGWAQMITSFMAEPTLTTNMLTDAIINFRENKNTRNHVTVKRVAAVYAASVFVNALLQSIVTAARDDDEDKTYLEKYLAEFTENFMDDINPLANIPIIQDIISIFEGYDVERADMALFSDLADAWKIVKNEDKTLQDKVTATGKAIGALFGIPVKNAIREVETIGNLIYGKPISETSSVNIKYGILEALPYTGLEKGKVTPYYERMADALIEGDKAKYAELESYVTGGMGKDEDAVKTGLKKELNSRLMDDFYHAVETGENLKKIVREMTGYGYDKSELSSKITSQYKDQYIALYRTNRVAATNLKARLLTAYAALGYDRVKKSKDIDAWLKEN